MTAKRFTALSPYSRDLVERAVNWMDEHWDEQVDLLSIRSEERFSDPLAVHHIRETSWYALGLLQRGTSGDVKRACRALQAVLRYQFKKLSHFQVKKRPSIVVRRARLTLNG